MPPKSKASHESLKQKSLMTWFSKDPAKSTKTPSSSRNVKKQTDSGKSASHGQLLPPSSSPGSYKSVDMDYDEDTMSYSATLEVPASTPSRQGSTPPTSDVTDIDMLQINDDEDETGNFPLNTRGKRKLVVDSDEDQPTSKASGRAKRDHGAPVEARLKKPRVALTPKSDEDDVKILFSQKLNRFKKSPSKNEKRRSALHSDDDEFNPASEQDEDETRSVKSFRSSSSRRSAPSSSDTEGDFIDDDEEDNPRKSKSKPAAKSGRKAKGNVAVADNFEASDAGSAFTLLTAAERREQGKKLEKKSTEEPFGFLQDVRDKDGKAPGDPKYDPRTLYIPPKAWKGFTPFEKQFWEIKQNHYDTVLFFQKGKFYELYEDDARIGHQEFDLKLTSRVKMSMVGVPEYALEFWAAKFLGKGYKVGRVEQAETALGAEMRLAATKSKGKAKADDGKEKIVRRELKKVYTNGTLVDAQLLTDDEAGHCIAICEDEEELPDGGKKFGVCVLDCATSQFNLSALEDDVCRTKLETLMRQVRPKEVLFTKGALSVSTTRLLKNILPSECLWTGLRTVEGFNQEQTIEELRKLYVSSNEGDAMEDDDGSGLPSSVPQPIREMLSSMLAAQALGNMIWYLRQLNIAKDILSMKNFNIYDPMKKGHGLTLDGQTLAHLEILLNNEGTETGTLLKLLNRCMTPFGKRLFRIWLCMPLREIPAINARLDAVQDIMNHPTFEASFTEIAKGLPDLERVVSRIHSKNCRVKDFLKVLSAFKKLSHGFVKLADESESFESKTILGHLRGAPDLLPNIKNVKSMFVEGTDSDELMPQPEKDDAYDEIMDEIKGLEKEFDQDLETMKEKLKIPLAYWHSSIGNKEIYLVETDVKAKNIPKDWVKSSGTKAKSRWVVSSLQKKIRQLKEARENRNTIIKAFKVRVYDEFDADRDLWLRAIRVFAELDCLFSLAKSSIALGEPACRPEFVDGSSAWVDFQDLRHPTLCLSASLKEFIPNNVKLGGDVAKIALLTGFGKSTVMRMTATGAIMAQLGMLVPATRARLCPIDAIITRMGAYDNMFSHASTFKVELDECCKILREATPRSLVILDELGRGTSTFDGMAIAAAVLHQLATHTLPLGFFATHYSTLTDDYTYHPNIRTMYMTTIVDDEKRDIVFLYKLAEGVATSSFGTHVANLAGVPLPVIERAEIISKNFAQQFTERLMAKKKHEGSSRLPIPLQADFAYLYKLAMGQLQLPKDEVHRVEVLSRMKETIRKYMATKTQG
ncbi:muts domain V-domain-containing protein [Amanita rubescens]|nr:muts domain V-domain-containing protein [Amanita rubescens]